MLARACYCTREDVQAVLHQVQSPRANPGIDRAIESATISIDSRVNRTFHPTIATKMFTWPDRNSSARSWRLWLDANDLLSVTTLTSGGITIPNSDYLLEPQRYGPPYTHLELNLGTSSGFSSGPSEQRAISIAGTWGYSDVTQAVTALAGAVVSVSAGVMTVADGSQVGVGDLLLIGTERVIVTGRSLVSTAQTLQTPLTASAGGTAVVVTTGTAYGVGEVITLDTESMRILDIAGNTLIVERAVNSSVLAAHSGSTIYAPRTLSVTRGANGTTAATHPDATTVARSVVPAPIRSLAVGESLVEILQGAAGYARTAGSGDNERAIAAGAGLSDIRDQVEADFGRLARMRAV